MGDIYERTAQAANAETKKFEDSVIGAVGQPSDMDTSTKENLVAAINELVASIGLIDASGHLAKESGVIETLRVGQVALNGTQTSVVFGEDSSAVLTGSATAPFDLTGAGDGATLVLDVDEAGDSTLTINAAAGTSTGDNSSPSEDMSGETDTKFKISVDGDAAEEVTCDWSGANSGANIATQMQTVVRALAGNKALVTVAWSTDHYLITSPTLGTDSAVVITPGDTFNCTEELEIGVSGGGSETGGTGDVGDLAAVTIAELIVVYDIDIASGTMIDDGSDHVVITSPTDGIGSSINVNASSDIEVTLGLATTITYGSAGLDYETDMDDANYIVMLTFSGTAGTNLGGNQVGSSNEATAGFIIECEDSGADDTINVMVVGVPAS